MLAPYQISKVRSALDERWCELDDEDEDANNEALRCELTAASVGEHWRSWAFHRVPEGHSLAVGNISETTSSASNSWLLERARHLKLPRVLSQTSDTLLQVCRLSLHSSMSEQLTPSGASLYPVKQSQRSASTLRRVVTSKLFEAWMQRCEHGFDWRQSIGASVVAGFERVSKVSLTVQE